MRNEKKQHNNRAARKNSGFRQKFGFLLIILLLVTPTIFAEMGPTSFMDSIPTQGENDVSDQELNRFGVALVEVQEIQMEANQQINDSIENAEIPAERLEEIFLIQQENPEQLQNEASPDEIEEFSQVMANISQIHQSTEIEIVDSLKQNSYDIQSFNQMAKKIQEDPELLNRLQTLFSNQQEGI